ncbi:MAG: hypothetical protein FJ395_13975 [Verrucomicrobia bacterium]|nr:hypothetical protein [Verrucomicrobiota bacterium]
MKATLKIINQMKADGVIGQYAIGGAVGATFYLEPTDTVDIDVFVSFRQQPGSALISLSPIYEYLRDYEKRGEYIVIGDWPVQFLPSANPLDDEALAQAIQTEVEGIPTWVMSAEHLVAIALRLGRVKDHLRIQQFIESGTLDAARLDDILARHGLLAKWQEFEDKYGREKP